jgi:hypothetical protein
VEQVPETGGPAFPQSYQQLSGMTLRDYFAGLAMQSYPEMDGPPDVTAEWAYEIADAMLKARK